MDSNKSPFRGERDCGCIPKSRKVALYSFHNIYIDLPLIIMSATSTSTSAGSAYLPAPPQAIAGGPTPQQQMDAGNAQFNALLKLIGGKLRAKGKGNGSVRSRLHPRRCPCPFCSRKRSTFRISASSSKRRRHKRKSIGHSRKMVSRRKKTHRHRRSRKRGGSGVTTVSNTNTLNPQKVEVATVPDKAAGVSYPSSTDIQVKLAATIAQNGANSQLDHPQKQ